MATVSARKDEHNSWLKVNLINGSMFLKYKLGVSPGRLLKHIKGCCVKTYKKTVF
jgi:hypothetical protein